MLFVFLDANKEVFIWFIAGHFLFGLQSVGKPVELFARYQGR